MGLTKIEDVRDLVLIDKRSWQERLTDGIDKLIDAHAESSVRQDQHEARLTDHETRIERAENATQDALPIIRHVATENSYTDEIREAAEKWIADYDPSMCSVERELLRRKGR